MQIKINDHADAHKEVFAADLSVAQLRYGLVLELENICSFEPIGTEMLGKYLFSV